MMSRGFCGLVLVLAACPDATGDSGTPVTSGVTTVPASEPTTGTGGFASSSSSDDAPTGVPPATTSSSDITTTSVSTGPGPLDTGGDTTGPVDPGTTTSTDDATTAPDCSDQPPTPAGPEVVIAPEFADLYTTYELGQVPGIPPEARLGGCIVAKDDPGSLLIAGFSEDPVGKLYKIGVERGACDHIVGFVGTAEVVADTPYIDANLLYVQSGLLFYPEWPVNILSQLLPGSFVADRSTDMEALGVAYSISGIGFVPPNLADPGGMRSLSWPGGEWYHLDRAPDGELFTISNPLQTATLAGGPGGFAYVPPGSPGFATDHVIVAEWSADTVGVYQVDAVGDPMERTRKDFFTAFPRPWGAYFEPLTGDYLFLTWGAGMDRVYIIQGFMPPPPIPG
ncbi:MAG: hypothetical protein JNL82_22050 [Myxococcales bacterium]|nr:hypothetical protein [Myxococcales bacterium]